ncbi:hypothetical protein NQK81_29010 [Amycolatopsis roodepoortensis]|uniref:hypothetical protein n=1 Tax=Amycolatopsis roodepoortensis TaxID=700274 RepID=UPI00214AA4CE|nr:hypothetical protein [Amycolatopsis roodepoortensis]UUV28809.1 hypothetical protein NQK81_29010 [Amycolatopsis roodepoortensis]
MVDITATLIFDFSRFPEPPEEDESSPPRSPQPLTDTETAAAIANARAPRRPRLALKAFFELAEPSKVVLLIKGRDT